jgi:hypothetical protein
METSKKNLPLPPPPGVIQTIVKGFNAVANHAGVLLIPIVFDLFLWLGPRFSIFGMMQPLFREIEQLPNTGQGFFEDMPLFYESLEGINVFAALRTFPLGVSSLMSTSLSLNSPLGQRNVFEPGELSTVLLFALLLTLAGWLLGCVYFYAVARVVSGAEGQIPSLIRALSQGMLLSGFWAGLWLMLSLPVFLFLGVLMLISPALMSVIYFLILLIGLWLAVPIFFSAHGIFLQSKNLFRATLMSFRMTRYALPSLGWFVIVAIVLSQGLGFLWRIAPADSWVTIFGIFGNAFISTALLAASFIYYRDLNIWVEAALEWMSARTDSVQA